MPFGSDNLPKALLVVPVSGDQVGCLGPGALLSGLEWNPHRESSQISLSGKGRQGLEHMRDPELEKVLETASFHSLGSSPLSSTFQSWSRIFQHFFLYYNSSYLLIIKIQDSGHI